MLGLQNEREWKQFCEKVLLDARLASDPRFEINAKRSEHREELKGMIDEVFKSLNAEQIIARLNDAQIANAHVNNVADLWQHPQLLARERFKTIDSPVGELSAMLPPGVHSGFDYRMDPVPSVGEHTQAILRELGMGESDIVALRKSSAV